VAATHKNSLHKYSAVFNEQQFLNSIMGNEELLSQQVSNQIVTGNTCVHCKQLLANVDRRTKRLFSDDTRITKLTKKLPVGSTLRMIITTNNNNNTSVEYGQNKNKPKR